LARLVAILTVGALIGCSAARAPRPEEATPGVVVPLHFAEGHGDGAIAEPVPSGAPAAGPSGSAAPGSAPRAFTSDPPDPQPLRLADQYEYTLHYEDAKIRLAAVRHVRFAKPVVTARRVGRYAVELWIGHELVDRVRFDFPLLAASEPIPEKRHKIYETPQLTGGPYTVTVLVPAAPRARSARLVDRATRSQAELSWPPAPAGLGDVTPMDPTSSARVATSAAPPLASAGELPAPPAAVPAVSASATASRLPPEPPARPTPPPPRELEKR
jgi:hypothetical protein